MRIGLLDPRSTVEVERVAKLLRRSPSELRDQTLVSLIALHDAHHPNLRVSLLDGLVEGRVELFDGGAFVTPYVGTNRFHGTVLHPAGTQAYGETQATMESALGGLGALRLGVADGRDRDGGDSVCGDDDLAELFVDLGSRRDLAELRRECVRSFEWLCGDVERALGADVDYF